MYIYYLHIILRLDNKNWHKNSLMKVLFGEYFRCKKGARSIPWKWANEIL